MAQDRWYKPITITSSNNSFVLTEDPTGVPTTYTVTIPAGTYAAYYSSSDFSVASSLYYAIRTALAAAGANNYAFSAATPSLSTEQTNAGLRINSVTSGTFRVDFNDASFTMDNRWFGFGTAETNTTSDGSDNVDSKYTVLSTWTSWTLTDGTASEKISHLEREINESSDRTADAYQVEWNEDRIRNMVYEFVPAAHVYENRQDALDATAYYDTAKLDATDNHNAFEQIWDAGSRLGDIIVQYDSVTDLDPINNSYSIVRFNDAGQRKSMRDCARITTRGGEFYTIDVELLVTAGNYDN